MNTHTFLKPTLAALMAASSAYADFPGAVVADSPLAYYRFEEAPGATTLADSSGNGLDIDYSFPAGTTVLGETAAVGLGARFNGDEGVITPLKLDPSAGDFTIEAVVQADLLAANGIIVSNQDGTAGTGRSLLLVNPDREYTTYVGGATAASGVIAAEDGFDHIILTYDQSASVDGVNPTLRFYINGIEVGTGLRVPEPADGNWVIGAAKLLTSQLFTGIIDEIAVYDTRLDDPNGDDDPGDSRVAAHYKEFLADSDTLVTFEGSAPYLDSGASADLSWLVSPVLASLTLDDGTGPVDVLGSTIDCKGGLTVMPTATTTYTLAGVGPLGTESLDVTIVVDEPAVIEDFSTNSASIPAGGTVVLSWEVTNGTAVEIDNGVGAVDAMSGSATVIVNETTTYTLTATNSQGPVTSTVIVEVITGFDPTLVAHWKVGETAGETSGSSLISETGDTYLGTFVGTPVFDTSDPAPVPGGSTASIVFDGAGSWVDILSYPGVVGDGARTLAFWFKGPAAQTNNHGTLIGWGTLATGARYDTRVNGNGASNIRTEVAGSGSNGTAVMADDTWHHCAVVFDPLVGTTIGNVSFYIDGVLDPLSVAGGTVINTAATTNVRIGSSFGYPERALTGKMDDIRIYSRALTEAEIVKLVTPNNTPLVITGLNRLESGNVELTWSGSPGTYSLEYSLNLTDSSWLEISDNEVINSGETSATSIDSFIAPNAGNTKVFYRFRKVE